MPSVKNIFKPNKKCIINTDLDGLLSGMLLQKFLNWEIVGFSYCSGKPQDELWIKPQVPIKDCVFVDLPVALKNVDVIDQHFVGFDEAWLEEFSSYRDKINPNILRNRVFNDRNNRNQYTAKYPFGTVHFILAVLEKLGIIPKNYMVCFEKQLGTFEVVDLICRADRVISNTCEYRPNCLDWSDWLINIGGTNTRKLFELVKKESMNMREKETMVENTLLNLGCAGRDGECSNLFRNKDFTKLNNYFNYLAEALELPAIPLFDITAFNKLHGERVSTSVGLDRLKEIVNKNNVFSFAFVSKSFLSITYIDDEDD